MLSYILEFQFQYLKAIYRNADLQRKSRGIVVCSFYIFPYGTTLTVRFPLSIQTFLMPRRK
jgi:hypothetical protein